MEDIPLRVSMEEQTFDNDESESDYLLSAQESGGRNGEKRSRRGPRNYGIEKYVCLSIYIEPLTLF